MTSSDRVIIFDTTLRDGEQALPQSLSMRQKLQIAQALEELGVDVIEAGFPVSSQGDFESVQEIARTLRHAIPCGLARAVLKDVDVCGEALKPAEHFRIHTFIATSTIHVKDKLRKSFDDVLNMGVAAIKQARRYTDDVEFSCEDAGRTPLDQLLRMIEAAIDAGATTINIPDTVGYTVPTEFGGIITQVMNRVPNVDKAVISVHCHNDLGMATANSITAVQMGARQIECCMNGLGERAGNCSLEEVAMAIQLRSKVLGGLKTGIIAPHIARTSAMVAKICHEPVPSHKAIVGSNAFSHSSGIHQDGVLKNRETYEILTPESVGFTSNTMLMTARSGRHMIHDCLRKLGYADDEYDLNDIYARFLKLADRKGQVFEYDLEALLFFTKLDEEDDMYHLDQMNIMSGSNGSIPTATVRLRVGRRTRTESCIGNGPVDAMYNCITHLTGVKITLKSYEITANGSGMDALGQVDVTVEHEGRIFHGMGLSTDVIEASGLALLRAINNIERAKRIHAKKRTKRTTKELVAEAKAEAEAKAKAKAAD
ncbi:2-isopropylmalate synthase [Sutterella sp.]|uniref:2-isopropylmalate synthase n=1 Tax=Sutterella sp. TaxID=1981025 RepID=UPI0026DFCF32|nr:2-isopropylmalate synthase [Sutterella sp.]MDO5532222.1 2-isopropylmalate synthase [Sutterella sp.]